MKHFFPFLLLFSTITLASVQVQPGLTLSQTNHSYHIHYSNSEYQVRDTVLRDYNQSPVFSYVKFNPDYYDYVGENCSPMYPAYTLHLELPANATNIRLVVNSISHSNITLPHLYVPLQLTKTGDIENICYDSTLYFTESLLDHYYADWYKLGQKYTRIFSKGVDFTFYPLHYHANGVTEIMTEADFDIIFEGDNLENLYNRPEVTAMHYFDNYLDLSLFRPIETPLVNDDGYLIITERQYQDSINYFKDYKESLGYRVFVKYVDDISSNPDSIRRSIISFYTGHHVKYVLLAGSLNKIPFSYGERESFTNPPSDIFYSCLENLHMDKQTDYHTNVYVGRWDVYNKEELSHIMRKTINSELHMYSNNSHRIASFSGTDNPKLSNIEQAKWVKTNVINASQPLFSVAHYLMGQFYDGRYASTSPSSYQDIKIELEDTDYPLWMFMYFGHGNSSMLGSPYLFSNTHINRCSNSDLPYQPFAFSFACDNADLFISDNFSHNWLTETNGGITIFAATESTIIECNKWFSRKIFSPLVELQPTMTIGELVYNAKDKYYYADQVPYRRNHIAKYILLGDPSLYIHGLNIPDDRLNSPLKTSSNEESTEVNKVKIWNINGILLEETSYANYMNSNLLDGVYIIQFIDKEDNVITTFKTIK